MGSAAGSVSDGAVRIAAPAKVNLCLHVTGRRDDGYHLLDSLVAFAGVFDRVTLEPDDRLSLTVNGPYASALEQAPPEDNIVLRAAWALAAASGARQGARIILHKVLPVAAGLGGGSADAAAALRGLCRLWNVSPAAEDLRTLALGLGADVPVCLYGRPARLSGIGEVLEPLPSLPEAWLLLANPRLALSTAAVFAARQGGFSGPAGLPGAPADAAALGMALARQRNDLTPAALALAPPVGAVLAALAAVPGCLLSRMSGSGATCFALLPDEAAAREGARTLRRDYPGWWVEPAPLLAAGTDPFALAERPGIVL